MLARPRTDDENLHDLARLLDLLAVGGSSFDRLRTRLLISSFLGPYPEPVEG
jgi:hypothetical protein